MGWLEAHPAVASLIGAWGAALVVAASVLAAAKLVRDQAARAVREEARRRADAAQAVQARAAGLVGLAETRLRRLSEVLAGASGTSVVLSGRAQAMLRVHERALTRFPFDELSGSERPAAFEEAMAVVLLAANRLDESRKAMEEVLAQRYAASEKARLLYQATLACGSAISDAAGQLSLRAQRLER